VESASAQTSLSPENTVNATWKAVLGSSKRSALGKITAFAVATEKEMSQLASACPDGPEEIAVVRQVWTRA